MQRVAGVGLADADADTAAGGFDISAIASGQCRISCTQSSGGGLFTHGSSPNAPVERHLVDIHRHRHIRLNPAELLAAVQRQRCFVRLAGVLGVPTVCSLVP